MEHKEDRSTMLHQIPSPAFLVENGVITLSNAPAQQMQLLAGSPVTGLLATGCEEYAQFQNGCLYLMLDLFGTQVSASVTAMGKTHLFILEQDADQHELRSMALVAQILRSPLSSVMTTAEHLFTQSLPEIDPGIKNQAATLNRGLYQILRVVCNMSDAYRYQGPQAFHGQIRDICALVREQIDLAAPLLEKAGASLEYSGPSESVFGVVDAEKLERAISNILSNAVKFAPKGSNLRLHLHRRDRMLYLTASDNGPGLPAQLQGNAYNRYLRSPGLEDPRYGLGLGMVMIRSAAAVHGGTVLMERGEDFGMRLTMTIPIRQTADPMVRCPVFHVDYAGELDHLLLELADCLPAEFYEYE